MKYLFAFAIICCLPFCALAQSSYTISGSVTDTTGARIQSATVFIAGAQNITTTDEHGNFAFYNMAPGNYELVVTMLGYNYVKQLVKLANKPEVVNIALGTKEIELQEVTIGSKLKMPKAWQLKVFNKIFLGTDNFAKGCKLLNPDHLKFTEPGISLNAKSIGFLTIENDSLGYRLKYLLKTFQYTATMDRYFYDGVYTFEPMKGTPAQQAIWDRNRRTAYLGSFMHYIRSVHAQTSQKEGFLTFQTDYVDWPEMDMKPVPLAADALSRNEEANQAAFKIDNYWMYVVYDPKAAAKFTPSTKPQIKVYKADSKGSIFRTKANFDSRGSLDEHKTLLFKGYWTTERIAYLLPFEYVYADDVAK